MADRGIDFAPDGRGGTSNEATETQVRIEMDGAGMLLFLPPRGLGGAVGRSRDLTGAGHCFGPLGVRAGQHIDRGSAHTDGLNDQHLGGQGKEDRGRKRHRHHAHGDHFEFWRN